MPDFTALVTLAALSFYVFLGTRVAAARGRFQVKLPAISGHPEFERIFRVQMNTLEWLPVFLVPLWLCALYLNDIAAAAVGVIWIAGRVLYYTGYRTAVAKRLPGFAIQASACLLLLAGAAVGVVLHLLRG
jgi:glutathione S-transferase